MSRVVRTLGGVCALALLLGACAQAMSAAEQSCAVTGIGVIKIDDERWTFAATTVNQINVSTFTLKDSGKRVLLIYRADRDANVDDAIAAIHRVVRGVNDLTITNAPKYKDVYLAAGVLANYETMKVENVGFAIRVDRPITTPATVFISTADNPMEDKDLLEISRQIPDPQKAVNR